jgi:hypothetical protein
MPSDANRPIPARMRPLATVIVALTFIFIAGGAGGDDWRHWSRFGKGSWKKVRTTSETLDASGNVISRSVSENEITLVERSERRLTLRVATTVQVAGKWFDTPPTLVVHGPLGESDGQQARVEDLPSDRVVVEGVPYDCQRQRVEIVGADTKRVIESASHEQFSLAPLHRVETLLDAKNETISTTTSKIVAVNLPQQVLDETRPATFVQTLHKNHKVAATTLAACCVDVPGQIVSASTKELDAQGRVVRRNTLQLVDFKAVDDDASGVITRAKHRREERRARRMP